MSAPSTLSRNSAARLCLGLLRRRMCLLPTWRGWVALLLAVSLGAVLAVRGVHGFLAVQDSVPGGVLVIEGWADDEALKEAWTEFQRGGYAVWCVTGEPLEKGAPLVEHGDYAALTVAVFEKMGGKPGVLQPVPWGPVRRDRTYSSALALKAWLSERGLPSEKINVLTQGAHARRSRLLYEKAFGPGSRIGVIAAPDVLFDAEHWWRSSLGVRAVIDELVAYVYARFLFRAT